MDKIPYKRGSKSMGFKKSPFLLLTSDIYIDYLRTNHIRPYEYNQFLEIDSKQNINPNPTIRNKSRQNFGVLCLRILPKKIWIIREN
jgi:hypothetical protein